MGILNSRLIIDNAEDLFPRLRKEGKDDIPPPTGTQAESVTEEERYPIEQVSLSLVFTDLSTHKDKCCGLAIL